MSDENRPVLPQDKARSMAARLRDYYTSDRDSYRIEHPICDEAADVLELAAKSLEDWQNLARFAEDRGHFFQTEYKALVADLLHNTDPQQEQRLIDLYGLVKKQMGPK